MVYTRLGIREIRQRPGRAILTLLSIVIGVAAVIAVSLASDTTGRAFDAIYETVAGKAAFEITAPFGTTFDASRGRRSGKSPRRRRRFAGHRTHVGDVRRRQADSIHADGRRARA